MVKPELVFRRQIRRLPPWPRFMPLLRQTLSLGGVTRTRSAGAPSYHRPFGSNFSGPRTPTVFYGEPLLFSMAKLPIAITLIVALSGNSEVSQAWSNAPHPSQPPD